MKPTKLIIRAATPQGRIEVVVTPGRWDMRTDASGVPKEVLNNVAASLLALAALFLAGQPAQDVDELVLDVVGDRVTMAPHPA